MRETYTTVSIPSFYFGKEEAATIHSLKHVVNSQKGWLRPIDSDGHTTCSQAGMKYLYEANRILASFQCVSPTLKIGNVRYIVYSARERTSLLFSIEVIPAHCLGP